MTRQIEDTITALASAPGPGGRAIVRISGPDAARVAGAIFHAPEALYPLKRRLVQGHVRLEGVAAPWPADLYLWPGPHSYTGQDMAEVHTSACPPLVDLLVAQLLRSGSRAAGPGEFTLRAYLAGKLDLPRAEAVRGVIEAGDRDELKLALGQLAGGMTLPLQALRDDLLNLLADVEAGLDFADEDIRFVNRDEVLARLAWALTQVTLVQRQLSRRTLTSGPFRVVLAGRPNVGKSSLFNALTGASALVSPEPGTTRDYLVEQLTLGGVALEVVDTPGWEEGVGRVKAQAQKLGQSQAERAHLVLLCLEAGTSPDADERATLSRTKPPVVGVATKCDRAAAAPGLLATSVVTGAGLDALRVLLLERVRARKEPALAPSWSRCSGHVEALLEHLRKAHHLVLFDDPPELLALELRGALDQLGELVGDVYTDDLLDLIFSRFCMGK